MPIAVVFMDFIVGSTNRVINDAGDGPGRDVMSGVKVLKERGIVD